MAATQSPEPRVVHLDDGRIWRGGQNQVWLLTGELAGHGVAQQLVTPVGTSLAQRARESGIEVIALEMRGELDWLSPRRIARVARDFDANLIHAHTSHAHALGLRALRRMGDGARLVSTRRVDFPVGRGFFSCRKYTAAGQHFIAISERVREVLIEGGVPAERIDVVASGVPPLPPESLWPRDRVRADLGIGPDEIAIVNVGALTDHKGQRWLIEASPCVIEAFPQARIHILGEGELRSDLESQIRRLGLERGVVLHGHIGEARLKLAGFDLYVSSSHMEGLGTATLDAMLAGLPVVAAAAGGVPEIVQQGRTGRLTPPKDAPALAQAIILALTEPDQSRRMADAARRRTREKFSVSAMAEGTLDVYRRLLARSL